jgi:hypothetical protein
MRIRPLIFPPSLPSDEAIKSWNQTYHNYGPEFWEFEYESYRYLERVSSDLLEKRYLDIIRNIVRIVSRERDVIPINSFLSSWYWYRKEHQTRLEFYLRGVTPPIGPPEWIPNNDGVDAPARPRCPNYSDVLFRFGKSQYMLPFFHRGSVRIGPASQYMSGMPGDPRTDDELKKHSFLPGKNAKVTAKSGKDIPVVGDIRLTVTSHNYFVLCMSCVYHKELFNDFNADTCVVILNHELFVERLSEAAKSFLPNWYFSHLPIQYFDPYNIGKNELLNPLMSKNFSFDYQMEYRFIWFSKEDLHADKHIFLELGSIEQIGLLHKL